jgi:hypothetical protein
MLRYWKVACAIPPDPRRYQVSGRTSWLSARRTTRAWNAWFALVVRGSIRSSHHVFFHHRTAGVWRDTRAGPAPVVAALRTFLGSWLGIGRIVVGMARQSYDLQLTRYGEEGWRATFYPAGRGHVVGWCR